jgi:signal transduction histidine kinase
MKVHPRKVRPGLLVALAFVVLFAVSYLGIVPWSVFLVVALLIGVIIVVISLVETVWVFVQRGRRVPIQTTLFRSVFVALAALFALVMVGVWWSQRQSSANQDFSGASEAMAWLNIAYRGQPSMGASDVGPSDPLNIGRRGLWIDAAAYARIKQVIDKAQSGGYRGNGSMLLDGRDAPPLRSILPPSVWITFRRSGSGLDIGGGVGGSLPTEIPPVMPSTVTDAQFRQHFRSLGDYLKEHGWKAGRTADGAEYAIWRTGPDTAEWIVADSQNPSHFWYEPWLRLPFQGAVLYVILAPFAGIAAWYLNRRIARPVRQVAEASVAVARGERPEPIPVKGPAELATLAESFNHMSQRLNQAEVAERQFLMSVSHELKTPLAAIEGYAELLGEGAVSPSDAAEVVTAESGRLKRLVADLIDLGKMRQSTFAVREELADLQRVADEVGRRYESQAREFGVELRVRPEERAADVTACPTVIGDEDRLVQVVSNLVENALRCTPAGGQVTIETAPPGSIRVCDSGPGLKSEDVEHAFERFYLYERSPKDRQVGTGLGLAIVKELTEAMGGTVRVESVPGVGSTFTVDLLPAEPAVAPS